MMNHASGWVGGGMWLWTVLAVLGVVVVIGLFVKMARKIRPSRTAFTAVLPLLGLLMSCSRSGSTDEKRATSTNPAPSAATVMPGQGVVFIGNEGGNSISVIDVGTGQVKLVAMRIAPHDVQVSRDGRVLLVVGTLADMTAELAPMKMVAEAEMPRGRLLIIDTDTLAVETAADIEIGRNPAHVVIDAKGERAYVTNSEDDDVLVIDVAQKRVVGEIKTGAFPHGLRISPDGREIYVANVKDDSISVLDVAQSKETMRIPVGKAPVQVSFTPDGRRAYVTLRDQDRVAVIDTAGREMIGTIAVGRKPIQNFVTPDGRYVYVANQGTDADPDNVVSVIDTVSHGVVATIRTGTGAHGVVVSDDGTRAFVTNIGDNTASVIDISTQKVIQTITVGEKPNGITFSSSRR